MPVHALSLQHRENTAKKRKIGALASSLARDGKTVILDAGSTTTKIANCLTSSRNLTVITKAPHIAQTPGAAPGCAVHWPGGQFKAPTLSLSGDKAVDYFHNIFAGKPQAGPFMWSPRR